MEPQSAPWHLKTCLPTEYSHLVYSRYCSPWFTKYWTRLNNYFNEQRTKQVWNLHITGGWLSSANARFEKGTLDRWKFRSLIARDVSLARQRLNRKWFYLYDKSVYTHTGLDKVCWLFIYLTLTTISWLSVNRLLPMLFEIFRPDK